MPSKEWFGYYARHFDTVELNNTFYRLPPEGSFDLWRQGAPDGFCFAVKFSRYGTHMLKLKNPAEPIERLLSRAKRLKEHLGPMLVQLPPKWDINVPRLAEFLKAAPRRQRWAIEFRDVRWLTQETYAVLRAHKAALCIHDMIPDHPREITADWVYMRFHGGRYDGNYSDDALSVYAGEIIGHLKSGLDVYAYFNNDLHGHALHNAATLKKLVLGRCQEQKTNSSKPAV
jgi:uncharacterized protein YecE (DUF72 family)